MDANDHALVYWVAMLYKHTTTILQFPNGVSNRHTVILTNQHAVMTLTQDAIFSGGIRVKGMAH